MASLYIIHSPIVIFVSILDMFTWMPEARTSSVTDSVYETAGGMKIFFVGMEVDG